MRTAIVLLVLLGLAAVPGSLLPQRGVSSDPAQVTRFFEENPGVAPWLDRLWLFDVYSAPWFAAIYVLLLVSMTGCVLPRCRKLWHEYRRPPAAGPRHLDREEGHTRIPLDGAPAVGQLDGGAALDRAEAYLRGRGFAVVRSDTEVRAERGKVRELGNLAFHLSLLLLLVGIASGRLLGYEGRAVVVQGATFSNVVSSYDAFTPAPWMDPSSLEPMSFVLDAFEASFDPSGELAGEPRDFEATVTYTATDESDTVAVRPNEPLEVGGTKFFLTGHGYAPELTLRDSSGAIVATGPAVFLPRDSWFTSDGVVKAPDAQPEDIGLEGVFHPSAAPTPDGLVSAFPDLLNPQVELTAWTGDLGLDTGAPQSVYLLDKTDMSPVRDGAQPWEATLALGESAALPGGASVTFDGVRRFANFQIARDPGKEVALVASLVLLVGLTVSLSVARRRVWVRLEPHHIDIAGRALARRGQPTGEIRALREAIEENH